MGQNLSHAPVLGNSRQFGPWPHAALRPHGTGLAPLISLCSAIMRFPPSAITVSDTRFHRMMSGKRFLKWPNLMLYSCFESCVGQDTRCISHIYRDVADYVE